MNEITLVLKDCNDILQNKKVIDYDLTSLNQGFPEILNLAYFRV